MEEANPVKTNATPRLNKYALACALLASTNSILLGYDIGVMSGAILYIKDNFKITSVQEEVLIGSLNVFSLIGSLASGKTSDSIGRRYTIVLAAATFFTGALLMGLAPSFPYLMAGRIIAGIGVGYSLMIAPVYTAELSPAVTRGFLTSLPEVFINLGILLGYITNFRLYGLNPKINWRLMLGLAAIPAAVVGGAVIAMPESPRWLVIKGRIEEAKSVLRKTSSSEEEAQSRLEQITTASLEVSGDRRGQGVWKELLRPSKPLQRILIAAIGINFFMQASGNDAVVYYTPEVFRSTGMDKKALVGVTVIMGTVKTSFVVVSALFLDSYGRRPLLLLGWPTWAIALCVLAVCVDISFFSIGLGPVTWVYSSEIFPTRLRAQGTSLAVSVNRLVSGAVSMSFLSISHEISFGGVFFVLAGIMVLASVFFYFLLPETRGKSLEDIGELFENKERDTSKVKGMALE